MKRVCVFCGSNRGLRSSYAAAARELGSVLGGRGIGLVYGGGSVGLMGEVATAALRAGAEVTGVIPEDLMAREVGMTELGDLRIVGSMHERKALMSEMADAFIALPGGLGTLEELFEVVTWGMLGLHNKACGALNVDGFFDPLFALLDHMVAQGFVRADHRAILLQATEPEMLLDMLEDYRPPQTDRWEVEL